MAKDTYKKRLKGSWNQGKACKGDGAERLYAEKEIQEAVQEMDPTHTPTYRKSKRRRNEKARLEHTIKWYQQAIERSPRPNDWLCNHFRDALKKAQKRYDELYGEEKPNPFPHYWICHPCATAKGGVWPKDHIATGMYSICHYCTGNEATMVMPYVDYDWPNLKTQHLRD